MQGMRSLKLELIPIDQELEHTVRKHRREHFSPRPVMANLINNGGDNPSPRPRLLRNYTTPSEYNAPSCIVLTPITQRFEIRPTIIQLLPSYHGRRRKIPIITSRHSSSYAQHSIMAVLVKSKFNSDCSHFL